MRLRFLHATLALLTTVGFGASLALASSHSEAPGTAKDRLADDTDLYAWVTADAPNKVTIVGNWVPLLEPNGGPNFYGFDDEAFYYFNIDNVGDAQDHVRFQFKFTTTRANPNTFLYNTGVVSSFDDPDLNVRQTWTLTRYDNGVPTVLAHDRPVAPNFVGPKSMPHYNQLAQSTTTELTDGTKIFVGPRDDPFFVDLAAIFDLLTIRRVPGNRGEGIDGVGGFNVMTIAMQIPKDLVTRDGKEPHATNSVIGIYDSAERFNTRSINPDGSIGLSGEKVQVSRLGNPLVNEVVIPLKDKDKFNRTKPTGDGAFLPYVLDPELPKLFNAIYGIPIPATDRDDLVKVFLTGIEGLNKPATGGQVPCEMLRLNLAIPPSKHPRRLGVLVGDNAGFPNGRRLIDDVVDIAERAAAGGYVLRPATNKRPANKLGDGVNFNDVPFLPYFPYVAPPHNPFRHDHHEDDFGKGRHRDRDGLSPVNEDDEADPEAAVEAEATESAVPLRFAGANPGTFSLLDFTVAKPSRVSVKVYDLQGREVRTLVDQDADAGTFRAQWDGRTNTGGAAGKGVYFARFLSDNKVVSTKKIVLE